MLALLPVLLAALLSYARSRRPIISVVGVDSNGVRVVYTETNWYALKPRNPSGLSSDCSLVVRERGHADRITLTGMHSGTVALSSDRKSLAIGEYRGGVTIYDMESLQALRAGRVLPESFDVGYLTFSHNGRYLAVCGHEPARARRNPTDRIQWCCVVIDAKTLAVTQELGPSELISGSRGVPYRVVRRKWLSGSELSEGEGDTS